jgi:hypothetical protein
MRRSTIASRRSAARSAAAGGLRRDREAVGRCPSAPSASTSSTRPMPPPSRSTTSQPLGDQSHAEVFSRGRPSDRCGGEVPHRALRCTGRCPRARAGPALAADALGRRSARSSGAPSPRDGAVTERARARGSAAPGLPPSRRGLSGAISERGALEVSPSRELGLRREVAPVGGSFASCAAHDSASVVRATAGGDGRRPGADDARACRDRARRRALQEQPDRIGPRRSPRREAKKRSCCGRAPVRLGRAEQAAARSHLARRPPSACSRARPTLREPALDLVPLACEAHGSKRTLTPQWRRSRRSPLSRRNPARVSCGTCC